MSVHNDKRFRYKLNEHVLVLHEDQWKPARIKARWHERRGYLEQQLLRRWASTSTKLRPAEYYSVSVQQGQFFRRVPQNQIRKAAL